jgi:hypothetical protein
MSDSQEIVKGHRGGMFRTLGLMICHFLAITIFFFFPVYIFPTVANRFEILGVENTSLFVWARFISDVFSGYKFLFWVFASVQLYIIFRLVRTESKWLSVYSHSILLLLSFLGMFYVAWMINPLVFVAPNLAVAPVGGNEAAATTDFLVIVTDGAASDLMQPSGEITRFDMYDQF